MPSLTEWKVPPAVQPRAEDYDFDLERVLSSVVGLHSIIPNDAFTADTLGVERAGNGVLIGDGLVLTIGYLITEEKTACLHLGDGRGGQGPRLRAPRAGPARGLKRGPDRQSRRGGRRRRTHAVGRGPHRRQGGVRRLL